MTEAEDLVQDAYLRFHRAVSAGQMIESPKAYLSAIVTRLAIDQLRSARVRREQYKLPGVRSEQFATLRLSRNVSIAAGKAELR